ncbi:MAG: GNAT family N-acetyltransferase [Candidatus Velthaea sp.]
MLVDGFRDHWPDAWPTRADAVGEVEASLEDARISRVALEGDDPVGWAGAMHAYDRVWELHPLVVRADRRRMGVGRALVRDLEARIARSGGFTIVLGTNDRRRHDFAGRRRLVSERSRAFSRA